MIRVGALVGTEKHDPIGFDVLWPTRQTRDIRSCSMMCRSLLLNDVGELVRWRVRVPLKVTPLGGNHTACVLALAVTVEIAV